MPDLGSPNKPNMCSIVCTLQPLIFNSYSSFLLFFSLTMSTLSTRIKQTKKTDYKDIVKHFYSCFRIHGGEASLICRLFGHAAPD